MEQLPLHVVLAIPASSLKTSSGLTGVAGGSSLAGGASSFPRTSTAGGGGGNQRAADVLTIYGGGEGATAPLPNIRAAVATG